MASMRARSSGLPVTWAVAMPSGSEPMAPARPARVSRSYASLPTGIRPQLPMPAATRNPMFPVDESGVFALRESTR